LGRSVLTRAVERKHHLAFVGRVDAQDRGVLQVGDDAIVLIDVPAESMNVFISARPPSVRGLTI
jgi:hypothetical protein